MHASTIGLTIVLFAATWRNSTSGRLADRSAVQVQGDAVRERLDLLFGKASVGAGRAGRAAPQARFDAAR
jgi:hypothetical protein